MGKADYLAKYYSADIPGGHAPEKRKKKSKRRRNQPQPSHITVVDEDVGWPTQTKLPDGPSKENGGDESDDGPVVENAAEVHHQLQLLQGQAKFSSQWETERVPAQSKQQQDSDDDSPPRRPPRHDTDDESPPRRRSPGSGAAASSPVATRQRHDSDNDSPPRRSQQAHEARVRSQQQPTSMQPCSRHSGQGLTYMGAADHGQHHGRPRDMHGSDDESPPRRPTFKSFPAEHDAGDESPPRRRKREGATDLHDLGKTSRQHEVAQHGFPDTHSRKRFSTDVSNRVDCEVRRRKVARHDSDDESPPRRQTDSTMGRPESLHQNLHDSTGTAHRLQGKHQGAGARQRHRSGSPVRSPPEHGEQSQGRAMSGSRLGQGGSATGGLVESHIMAEQIRQKRQEEQKRILEMDPSQSGRGASSTFRVEGKIVTKEEYEETMAAKQYKRQPRYLEEDVEWKSGLAQRRAAEAEQHALERESKKKFQREFDEDADAHMQQELRMDDPMAQYFAAKQRKQGRTDSDSLDAHANELSSKSGFIVPQAIPQHSWIKRDVQPLPNRYKIKPGRHWDGVHRGNGFEQKFVFQYQHNRAERERDRYVLAEDL